MIINKRRYKGERWRNCPQPKGEKTPALTPLGHRVAVLAEAAWLRLRLGGRCLSGRQPRGFQRPGAEKGVHKPVRGQVIL